MSESRVLLMSHDMIQAVDHGARLLTTLAALERAWMLDDQDSLASIFDGIDPIEVQLTSSTLHALDLLWHTLPPFRGGSTLGSPDGDASPARGGVTESDVRSGQPSAPIPFPTDRARCG